MGLITTLTEPQSAMFSDKSKYIGVVAGYGAGKTKSLLTKVVVDLIKYRTNLAYYAPYYHLIEKIAYPVLSEILQEVGVKFSINKSDKVIKTSFGWIYMLSMENYSSLIGYEVLRNYVDEFDTMPTTKALEAFHRLTARARIKPKGGAYKGTKGLNRNYVCTTPEGFKAMYHLFKNEKTKISNSRLIQMPTSSNPHLDDDYVPDLMAQYLHQPQLIEAFLKGEFVNLTAGLVYIFKRDLHVVPQTKPSPTETLHIGQDFNVGQMASVVFVARKNRAGGRVWLVIDELTQGRDTPDTIEKIKERYPRNPIIMYPDASGKNRSSKSFSKSDHSLLRQAGFEVRVSSKNPLIKDRVASVNNAFSKNKLFISDECITIIEGLEQQAYDKDGMPEKTGNDHSNDALGYFIFKTMPVATSLMRYEAISHL